MFSLAIMDPDIEKGPWSGPVDTQRRLGYVLRSVRQMANAAARPLKRQKKKFSSNVNWKLGL